MEPPRPATINVMERAVAAEWLNRWEAQQARCVRDRERRFDVMIEAVAQHAGSASPLIIDLGCGPGSLAHRLTDALPQAHIVAVDMDPVLLAIGHGALADNDRLRLIDADLVDPALDHLLGEGAFDVAVSSTALHWLTRDGLATLYRTLASVMRPGGLFLNADAHFGPGDGIDQLCRDIAHHRPDHVAGLEVSGETWDEWWQAAMGAPELGDAASERLRRHWDHPESKDTPTLTDHRDLLGEAGFSSTGCIWQDLTSVVLAAIR